jgi:hypothetical protein
MLASFGKRHRRERKVWAYHKNEAQEEQHTSHVEEKYHQSLTM